MTEEDAGDADVELEDVQEDAGDADVELQDFQAGLGGESPEDTSTMTMDALGPI